MTREILTWPDDRLKSPCADVEVFDAALAALAADLKATCLANNGLGLAASQIGVLQRVVVVMDDVFVNPGIVAFNGVKSPEPEGCLSFPGVSSKVERWPSVVVEYQDVDGTCKTKMLHGLAAQVAQHEIDHLEGITMADQLDSFSRERFLRKFKIAKRRVG